MTLLITVFAAAITTIVFYSKGFKSNMNLGTLALMYWGAAIMWLVDAVVEYIEIGVDYFSPAPTDMLNDTYLGLSVVALGLVIWIVVLLVKDPKNAVKNLLNNK